MSHSPAWQARRQRRLEAYVRKAMTQEGIGAWVHDWALDASGLPPKALDVSVVGTFADRYPAAVPALLALGYPPRGKDHWTDDAMMSACSFTPGTGPDGRPIATRILLRTIDALMQAGLSLTDVREGLDIETKGKIYLYPIDWAAMNHPNIVPGLMARGAQIRPRTLMNLCKSKAPDAVVLPVLAQVFTHIHEGAGAERDALTSEAVWGKHEHNEHSPRRWSHWLQQALDTALPAPTLESRARMRL